MNHIIFKNDLIRIEVEPSEIPWLKVFTKREVREFSDCTNAEKNAIFTALDIIEKEMLNYFKPEKINIASFGNVLPQVHWHIMARFATDSHFPQPMWGEKQRESQLDLPDFEVFYQQLISKFIFV